MSGWRLLYWYEFEFGFECEHGVVDICSGSVDCKCDRHPAANSFHFFLSLAIALASSYVMT